MFNLFLKCTLGNSLSHVSGITVPSTQDNCMRAKKQCTDVSQDVYSYVASEIASGGQRRIFAIEI